MIHQQYYKAEKPLVKETEYMQHQILRGSNTVCHTPC